MLNKNVKRRHTYCDPSLRKKSIQSFIIKYTICYRLFTDILYQVRQFPSTPVLLKVFVMSGCWIL